MSPILNFKEIPSVGALLIRTCSQTDGRTDMVKIKGVFRVYAKALKS